MVNKARGKKIGFLMSFPFQSTMNPFQHPFFATPPQGGATVQQQQSTPPSIQQNQPTQQNQATQNSSNPRPQGFSFQGLDSMFQNTKKFMGYVDQAKPLFKNLAPMLQMFTGTQANAAISRAQKSVGERAIYKQKKG
ncbi:hypothetical protein [Bacillus horti]|uniref:YqfQ-like protein n=1 Tax=Caldalkalibacillus horti TaxID=77523 RepID=A0ABT9VVZ5_9BACI|nr:hypothetical protein [Bacillus horti]MDQ0165172.1 hypothetical protein [Bacillus horti]